MTDTLAPCRGKGRLMRAALAGVVLLAAGCDKRRGNTPVLPLRSQPQQTSEEAVELDEKRNLSTGATIEIARVLQDFERIVAYTPTTNLNVRNAEDMQRALVHLHSLPTDREKEAYVTSIVYSDAEPQAALMLASNLVALVKDPFDAHELVAVSMAKIGAYGAAYEYLTSQDRETDERTGRDKAWRAFLLQSLCNARDDFPQELVYAQKAVRFVGDVKDKVLRRTAEEGLARALVNNRQYEAAARVYARLAATAPSQEEQRAFERLQQHCLAIQQGGDPARKIWVIRHTMW